MKKQYFIVLGVSLFLIVPLIVNYVFLQPGAVLSASPIPQATIALTEGGSPLIQFHPVSETTLGLDRSPEQFAPSTPKDTVEQPARSSPINFDSLRTIIEPFQPALDRFREERREASQRIFIPPSEEAIFETLWPSINREALAYMQDQFIQLGYLDSPVVASLDTEEEIFTFMNASLDIAIEQGFVSPDDEEQLRNGLNVSLRELHAKERLDYLRYGLPGVTPPLEPQSSDSEPLLQSSRNTLFPLLAEHLSDAFRVPTAHAVWISIPFCLKDLNPGNVTPPPGPNLWSFCCNCGIVTRTTIPFFLQECGSFGSACDVPLGCLNLMCRSFPNALQDNPGTLICGCG
ncbi:MAG: hypothetical protein COU08_00920 [Candidatus Harrisonbacteria bacterium CG10_big_fil_rev_8_21_14_0_10_42_17]|uniref:Uncharacterized protein n=1 Tax=Candidatus Harrisonbacteria bacterium CG10_big_fil_rev_8_21_14_0_10_42_17 TaxID=1974584 RepID=A0A2M6WIT5_9BACT|nr:MAG: hypothetical protein COU08_00920 [Candidatus Harrisonbacteria bacterium CG10_big_fil_rev_8_21_14_0_10_42_17]